MYVVRFGSYSIVATLAGTPSLVRRKSILRYRRFAPPPRWREVMRPCVLRPPDLALPSVSGLCGTPWVSSSRSWKVAKRRPGEVGFDLRIAISITRRLSGLSAYGRQTRQSRGWLGGYYSATAAPSNNSIRSPGASSTTAFFHDRVRPE